MGGRRRRRSSKVVLRESRRFCSAALWEVLRPCMVGVVARGVEVESGVEVVRVRGGVVPARLEEEEEEEGVRNGVEAGKEGEEENDEPGRMAFRLGLTREPLVLLRGVRVREDEAGASLLAFAACLVVVVVAAAAAAALPFTTSGLGAIDCPCPCPRVGGARLLLIPSRPRFIMLAGVTGVSCGLKFRDGGRSAVISGEVFEIEIEFDMDEDMGVDNEGGTGGAGGGIDRSTGEGVSPGISPAELPFRDRVDRSSGVEFVDLEPRKTFLDWPAVGLVGRIAGDCCFFREGCMPMLLSSSLVEAWRLLLLVLMMADEVLLCMDCWCAPSHGLVRGDMSKSRSAGDGR
jgi:hypothetical protein